MPETVEDRSQRPEEYGTTPSISYKYAICKLSEAARLWRKDTVSAQRYTLAGPERLERNAWAMEAWTVGRGKGEKEGKENEEKGENRDR